MTSTTIPTEITDFAARVRAALADLGPDEVDDLTEGLEADLAEAYAEDLQRELPDPVEYATELRVAAGLPQRTVERRGVRGAAGSLLDGLRATAADVVVALRRNPATRSVLDFAVAVRPLWWVLRAWLAVWLLSAFFGSESSYFFGGIFVLLFPLAVVVSVQWGRGEWGAEGVRPLLTAGNVLAVVVLLPVLALADDGSYDSYDVGFEDGVNGAQQDLAGLHLDGQKVTNIFAYRADGRPLDDVQLFDQEGRPLETTQAGVGGCVDDTCAEEGVWVARVTKAGQQVFNVFPLSLVPGVEDDMTGAWEPAPGAEPQARPRPFERGPVVVPQDRDALPKTRSGSE